MGPDSENESSEGPYSDPVVPVIPAGSTEGRFRLYGERILGERVAQVVERSQGVLDLSDPGQADLLWLAARRLRAALELFRPSLSKTGYRSSREEVTRLGRAVGARRNSDVAISLCELIGSEMGPQETEGTDRAIERLRQRQTELNRDLAQQVHGRRLQAFQVRVEDLAAGLVLPLSGAPEGEPREAPELRDLPEDAVDLVARRLKRLRSLASAGLEPDAWRDHHRMRVAAERLRYALELTAAALGSQAQTARRAARGLQEVLGDVRDSDLAMDPVRETILQLESEDVTTVLARARGSRDLDPVLVQAAPNRAGYRGLLLTLVHLRARRQMTFERFRRLWLEQSRQGVWVALETSLGNRITT